MTMSYEKNGGTSVKLGSGLGDDAPGRRVYVTLPQGVRKTFQNCVFKRWMLSLTAAMTQIDTVIKMPFYIMLPKTNHCSSPRPLHNPLLFFPGLFQEYA